MIAKLRLILRFYRSEMLFFCGTISVALSCSAAAYGPSVIPLCLLGKAAIYPFYLYVWIMQRYADEFHYYRNLGIRRHQLLGIACTVDWLLCLLLLELAARILYDPH